MQKKVSEFNEKKSCHTKPMPVYARIIDIQSELGELGKEYLKSSKYGTADFEVTEDFKMEFGDVIYSVLSLANELGIDSEKCLNLALEKYKKRIEKSSSMQSGK